MRLWLLKSALHRLISVLPGSQRWNELFQTHVTRSLDFDPMQLRSRFGHARTILEYFFARRPVDRGDFKALELGTGWYPYLSIALYLCGASEVWTFDLQPLLTTKRLCQLLDLLEPLAASGELTELLPWARADRVARLRAVAGDAPGLTPAEWFGRLGVHVRVGDARENGIADGTLDLACSYGVIEYIDRGILVGLHKEFARAAKPGAVAVHLTCLDDEYAKFDRRLSPYNFLRYTDWQWRWLRSALNPLNRLRISDHRAALLEGGWKVVEEANETADPAALEAVPLAPEFRHYRREDLAVTRSWLVAERMT
jgi:SAM-dependent methyltransferase